MAFSNLQQLHRDAETSADSGTLNIAHISAMPMLCHATFHYFVLNEYRKRLNARQRHWCYILVVFRVSSTVPHAQSKSFQTTPSSSIPFQTKQSLACIKFFLLCSTSTCLFRASLTALSIHFAGAGLCCMNSTRSLPSSRSRCSQALAPELPLMSSTTGR